MNGDFSADRQSPFKGLADRVLSRPWHTASNLIQRLATRDITKKELEEEAEGNPALVPKIVEGLASPKAAVRNGCARVLMNLSGRHPEWLYSHWEAFAGALDSGHRILSWGAIATIANLSAVDSESRFEAIFDRYYALIGDGYMVTVANVVGNSAKVARAKPRLADRIAEKLLGVEKIATGPHMTDECRRVVAEKAVEALGSFYHLLGPDMKKRVSAFVKKQLKSSRVSLAETAKEFLVRNG